ncbi:peptidase family S58 [Saccharata proteae CBS 121410]|uniref:Peptidase family S58 n=1 Tax=Saccharata proteae CBS 121410 TaxID=1314787 RepID=A0A9P4LYH0_9PEZI|nr:peptidase family S58 [Saccharata proteae CBS 121410]
MSSSRCRIRNLLPEIHLGNWAPGPKNSLTDVPGVLCHTQSIILPVSDSHGPVSTGFTTILPRADFFHKACFAGMFRLNGSGEFTGSHRLDETGLLHSPIVLINSFSVGAAYQGIYEYCIPRYRDENGEIDWFMLPTVGETFDGILSDISALVVQPSHIVHGIENASAEPVPEGGTGSASRIVPTDPTSPSSTYTVAALVQANYGAMRDLRISGAPIGRLLQAEQEAAREKRLADPETQARAAALEDLKKQKEKKDGSIIIVLATDAPLHPTQLQRVAKRATMGLARVGGNAHNPSGDIFLAFSTGNAIPVQTEVNRWHPKVRDLEMVDDQSINGIFEAAAEAVEESIYNALCMAETMTGRGGRTIEALPRDRMKELMAKYA